MSRPWTAAEIALLKTLETDPTVQCSDIAAQLGRSKRACWQQFYRMRKAGLVTTSARRQELNDEQRALLRRYRIKAGNEGLQMRGVWPVIWGMAA